MPASTRDNWPKTACPACGSIESKVRPKRLMMLEPGVFRRHRECMDCGCVYETAEKSQHIVLHHRQQSA